MQVEPGTGGCLCSATCTLHYSGVFGILLQRDALDFCRRRELPSSGPMRARFLPSVLFGLTTAVVTAVVWIVVKFVLPIAIPYLAVRPGDDNVGGASAEITTGSILLALLFGFASGFFWRFRRLSP